MDRLVAGECMVSQTLHLVNRQHNVPGHCVKYSLQTLGNHEFDAGVGPLTTFLQNLTFPVVSANIDASKEPTLAACFIKSTVVKVTGEMIGIVGYTTPDTKATSNPGNDVHK